MIYNQLRIKALFVRAKGIEPIRLTAPDPKSGLSTNFNTPADFYVISFRKRSANILLIFESASITPKYKKKRYLYLFINITAIRGSAMIAIVALIGRYIPKFTWVATRYVISRRPVPIAEDIR